MSRFTQILAVRVD